MKFLAITGISLFCLFLLPASAQEKSWSSSAALDYPSSQINILGKGKEGYYATTIHKRRKTYLSIYHYDHSLKLREENSVELPSKADLIGVHLLKDQVLIFYLKKSGNQAQLKASAFDQNLTALTMNKTIKSLNVKNTAFETQVKDTLFHFVFHDPQTDSFQYLSLNAQLVLKTENQWQAPEKQKKFTMADMAINEQSLALLLQSQEKGTYCLIHDLKKASFYLHNLSNDDHFVGEAMLEADQIKGAFVTNGFYKKSHKANEYIGTAFHVFDQNQLLEKQYQPFPRNYIEQFYGKTTERKGLENVVTRKLIPRSDGGSVFLFEEVESETQIYRDFSYYGFNRSTSRKTYYYDNIGVIALSNMGKIEWTKIHRKHQIITSKPKRFASFSVHVTKRAIIFLYNRNTGNDQDLLSYSIKPSGNITGDLLLKADESNADPIAKEARQVAHNEVIVPSYIDREKLVLLRLRF